MGNIAVWHPLILPAVPLAAGRRPLAVLTGVSVACIPPASPYTMVSLSNIPLSVSTV